MTTAGPPATVRVDERVRWPIGAGALMIVAGALAVAMPRSGGIAIGVFIGWLVLLNGAAHLLLGRHTRRLGLASWELLLAMLALLTGALLLAQPERIALLTTGLGVYLFVNGALDIVASAGSRPLPGAGWLALDGIVSLAIAVMIWRSWPAQDVDAIGALVGITMTTSGVSRVMLGFESRIRPRSHGKRRASL